MSRLLMVTDSHGRTFARRDAAGCLVAATPTAEEQRVIDRADKARGWCIIHNQPHYPTAECCRHVLDACHCAGRTGTITKDGLKVCIDCGRQLCMENHPRAPRMR